MPRICGEDICRMCSSRIIIVNLLSSYCRWILSIFLLKNLSFAAIVRYQQYFFLQHWDNLFQVVTTSCSRLVHLLYSVEMDYSCFKILIAAIYNIFSSVTCFINLLVLSKLPWRSQSFILRYLFRWYLYTYTNIHTQIYAIIIFSIILVGKSDTWHTECSNLTGASWA